MKCEYCNTQWEEDTLICPNCGAEALPEEEPQVNEDVEKDIENEVEKDVPQSGAKWWKILLIALAGVVLGGVLTVLILMGSGVELFPAPTPKDTYFADVQTVKDNAQKTVATAGENVLTNGRFQVYYWSTFLTFLQNNGMYYFDISKPLSQQYVSEGVSWEDYFIDSALNNWHCYAVLSQMAKQEGFVMPQEVQDYLDGLPEYLETIAQENGCADAQALVEQEFGPGATVADYVAYMQEYTLAMEFYNSKYNSFQPTDQQIEEYFAEHESEFAANGITRDSKLVNVRHILIKFHSESGSTTYTDEEKENCKTQAQQILDLWLAGEATEESFGILAQEHSEDPGSASKGGLYEDVPKNYMTANFDAWMFDPERQIGDFGLVETEYGYHVMFFAGSTLQWPDAAKTNLIAQMSQDLVKGGMEIWPSEIKYENLAIGNIDLGV